MKNFLSKNFSITVCLIFCLGIPGATLAQKAALLDKVTDKLEASIPTQHESSTKHLSQCGATPEYFASLGVEDIRTFGGPQSLTQLNVFPAYATETCGRFILYYEDMIVGNGNAGFNDPIEGANRRNTLCAVLTYLQSTLDFSQMTANDFIRLHVDTSYSPLPGPIQAPFGTGFYAHAGAGYFNNNPGIVNGFVYDYIHTGIDPAPNADYHADMAVNFDKVYDGNNMIDVNYLNNYNMPLANCQLDLFTILLHEMGHALGWFSLVKYTSTYVMNQADWGDAVLSPVVTNTNIFSGLDYSMHVGAQVYPTANLLKLITGPLNNPALNSNLNTPQANTVWMNNLAAPQNYPVFSGRDYISNWAGAGVSSYGSHLDDQMFTYTNRQRISPGEVQQFVMGPFGIPGVQRRTFSKGEIECWRNLGNGNLSYQLNTNYAANNATQLANHTPFSKRMAGYNNYADMHFSETVPADFTIANNGSSLVINLATDNTLVDADGDPISVMPGTLVNFRGCGNGGNNHAQLSTGGQQIMFIPRPNFVGRAQFGFNLWDGKEKGSFVIYTIDVNTGSNVNCAPGSNIALNGNFEQGSEVKILGGINELINNTTTDQTMYEGKLLGRHFTDCHPFPYGSNWWVPWGGGALIRNSFFTCSQATTVKAEEGHAGSSFPPNIYFNYPNPPNGGDRFAVFMGYNFELITLCTPVQSCKRYRLEYDVYSPYSPATSFQVGFGDPNVIAAAILNVTPQTFNFTTTTNASPGVGAWQHVIHYFWYCGSPSNMMCLTNMGGNQVCMDNISLTEDLSPQPPMTVSITQAPSGTCNTLLTANITNARCGVSYQWQHNNVNIPGATSQTYDAPSYLGGTFKVIATDECQTIPATVNFPQQQYCSQCSVLNGNYTTITGPITQNLPPGNYYIPPLSNIAINGNVTLSGANIFVDWGSWIRITSTSDVTISHCHLFGCSTFWQGIILESTQASSASLSIQDNTLIEDAISALIIQVTSTPVNNSYILRTNDVVFNRNSYAIDIQSSTSTNVGSYYSIKNTVFASRDLSGTQGYPQNWPDAAALKTINNNAGVFAPPYMLDTYPLVLTKGGSPAVYGIFIESVGTTVGPMTAPTYYEIQIGSTAGGQADLNLFDNMRYGIGASTANFKAVNNAFTRMTSSNNIDGDGIYAAAGPSHRANIVKENGLSNRFYNCVRGVEVKNYFEVVGKGSYMISDHTTANMNTDVGLYGYKVTTPRYKELNISDNVIYNLATGIYCGADFYIAYGIQNQDAGALHANGNTIGLHPSGSAFVTNQWTKNAITIENLLTCNSCSQLYSGTMSTDANTISDVYNGIGFSGFKLQASTCNNNTVSLRNAQGGLQYGIKHTNCQADRTNNNIVTGFNIANYQARGIYAEGNSNHKVDCNQVLQTDIGFEFFMNQPNSEWRSNDMTNNGRSFVLNNGAIGHQDDASFRSSNEWHNILPFTYSGSNYTTYTIGSADPLNSKLYVLNPSATEYPSNNGTFGATSYGPPSLIASSANPTPCPQFMPPPINNDLSEQVAFNQLSHGVFQGVGNWISQYHLWETLTADATLINGSTALSQFKTMGDNSRFAMLAAIDYELVNGNITNAQTLLADPNLMVPQPNMNAAGVTIADAIVVNSVINNYITFYNLYIKYLNSTLTAQDLVTIDELASRCPLSDGYPVFKARVLHNLVSEDMKVYENNCPLPEVRKKEANGLETVRLDGQRYTLSPNPNNGDFTIMQAVSVDGYVKVEILNVLGMCIYKGDLNFANGSSGLKLNAVAKGTYLLKLVDKAGLPYTTRFTVL